jgi:protein OS-9
LADHDVSSLAPVLLGVHHARTPCVLSLLTVSLESLSDVEMFVEVLSAALVAGRICLASETSFSVNDDLFAFPQYEVVYSETYIPTDVALEKVDRQFGWRWERAAEEGEDSSLQIQQNAFSSVEDYYPDEEYQILQQNGRAYFCTIPLVKPMEINQTEETPSAEDEQKELARATDKGRELLQGMEGGQCLFYTTGWWTYSFCYNSQARQFHALSPGATGGRVWPPQEDPTTPAYVLGKFDSKKAADPAAPDANRRTDLAELQTKAETSYLVQRLDGGTPCDLTGKPRKVDVEFHCNPQLTDRIGWIKETATCAYLMIIYTPRLCNDVAFVPPKESRAHPITCQQMLSDEDIPAWEAWKTEEASRQMIGEPEDGPLFVGDIEIGARKIVGKDKTIERGRIVLTQDEKAEIIIMQKDGQVSSVSPADLKKLDLDPDDVEAFRKELQKLAGDKDWKIERLDDVDGAVQLRGIVSTSDGKYVTEKTKNNKDGGVTKGEDEKGEEVEGNEEEDKEEI